jgi:glycosyltransferase involved in cell wall biosynthesis
MPDYSLVIPVFNERDNLLPLLKNIREAMSAVSDSYEIIFVDDGSQDGSSQVLDKIKRENSICRLIVFDRNYGQSSALAAGFKAAKAGIIITLDADLQVDAREIPRLLEKLKDFDMVCGNRGRRSDSMLKRLSSRFANAAVKSLQTRNIRDVGCPLRVFRSDIIQNFVYFDGMHRFLPILAEMAGFSLVEVKISHAPRVYGKTKYSIRNRIRRAFIDLLGVRWLKKRRLKYHVVSED